MNTNMILRRLTLPLILILTSMWWGWTLLVDAFIIPTVFGYVEGFFLAGELGIAVFSKLNGLEVIVSSFLLALISLHFLRSRKPVILVIVSLLAWIIVMIYFSYLTPKIVELTKLWKQAEETGLSGIAGIPDIQQAHQFYHNLYIKLDVIKLIILSTMLGIAVWKQEELR